MPADRQKASSAEGDKLPENPLSVAIRAKIAGLPSENPAAVSSFTLLAPASSFQEAENIRFTHTLLQLIAEGNLNLDTLDAEQLRTSFDQLELLGAIDEKKNLTDIGLEMAILPFEPRLARMVVEAQKRECLEPTLVMASFMTVGDVFAHDQDKKGRKANIGKARASFSRGNSDWLTHLNVFEQAVDHGLFESLEGKASATEFERWCELNHLELAALKKASQKIMEMTQAVGIDFKTNPKPWGEICKATTEKDLTAVILSGNADRIFSENSLGSRGDEKIYSATFSEDWTYISSEHSHCDPAQNHFVAGSMKFSNDKYKEGTASHLHPVSISDIVEVLPHLVETAPVQGFSYRRPIYDPHQDCTLSLNFVRKKNDRPGIFSLGQAWLPMTLATDRDRELAAEALLNYLSDDKTKNDTLPFIKQNRDVLRRLEHLYHCVKHDSKYDQPNLRRWYQERLNKCASVSDILEAGLLESGALDLKVEEVWTDAEQLAEYNRMYPAEFSFRGKKIPISYRRRFEDTPLSENPLTATFDLSNLTVEELLDLNEEDLPTISDENLDTDLAFFTQIDLNPTHGVGVKRSLSDLQSEIEDLLVFTEWIATQTPVVVLMNSAWRALPTVEALGFEPKEIGRRSDGFPVQTYPAIKAIVDRSQKFLHFEVSYTLRKDVADALRGTAEWEFGFVRRNLDSAQKKAEAERIKEGILRNRETHVSPQQVSRPRSNHRNGDRRHSNQDSDSTRENPDRRRNSENFGTMADAFEAARKKDKK